MTENKSKREYYDSLPRKRGAVGVLILQEDKILVLEATYKTTWLIPGGVIDLGESPLAAAVRESLEEISVKALIEKLLVVDYKPGDQETGDAVHYLFLGALPEGHFIQPDGKEIKSFRWVAKEEALTLLGSHLSSRVAAGFEALNRDQTVYCEDGRILL